jgi:hypothetical protein
MKAVMLCRLQLIQHLRHWIFAYQLDAGGSSCINFTAHGKSEDNVSTMAREIQLITRHSIQGSQKMPDCTTGNCRGSMNAALLPEFSIDRCEQNRR